MVDPASLVVEPHAPTKAAGPLTDVERAVLEFERLTWRSQGAREAAIWELFGWSPTRHASVALALLDRPEAEAYDPAGVRARQRVRDRRAASRRGHGGPTVKRQDRRGVRPRWEL